MTNSQRSAGATRRGEHRVGHDDELAWCGGGVGGGATGASGFGGDGGAGSGGEGADGSGGASGASGLGGIGGIGGIGCIGGIGGIGGSGAQGASREEAPSRWAPAADPCPHPASRRREQYSFSPARSPPPRPCRPRRRPSRRAPGQTRPIVASGWPTWRRARCCGRGQRLDRCQPWEISSSQSSSVKFPVKKTRTLDQPSRASLEASTASHV